MLKRSLESTGLKELVALCKKRGFVFQGSELYGGLAGSYDYGPLGVQMKKNLKDRWWKCFITSRSDCVGIESPIIMNSKVWKASGHVDNFVDQVVTCLSCNTKHRVDHLVSNTCPNCQKKEFSEPKPFNLLFETNVGPTIGDNSKVFLRPETAQGMFVAFQNVYTTMRKNLPFGIGQVGKSFRNEVNPRDFLFRTREFEQAELEFFCHEQTAAEWYRYWVDHCWKFLLEAGIKEENLRKAESGAGEGAHYALATTDIEYRYPFGWSELWGIANRGNYDLSVHSQHSGNDIQHRSKDSTGKDICCVPYVIEPALGIDRLFFACLVDAYTLEKLDNGEERNVMKFHPDVAPIRHAVMSVRANHPEMETMTNDIANELRSSINAVTAVDNSGSIGRRYRRQDEVGTPFCITVDGESLEKKTVTIRHRDTMQQVRLSIQDLVPTLSSSKLFFEMKEAKK